MSNPALSATRYEIGKNAPAKKLRIETLALEDLIRRRAYELYIERGNQLGSELDDWLQAEEEIQRAEEQAVSKS